MNSKLTLIQVDHECSDSQHLQLDLIASSRIRFPEHMDRSIPLTSSTVLAILSSVDFRVQLRIEIYLVGLS